MPPLPRRGCGCNHAPAMASYRGMLRWRRLFLTFLAVGMVLAGFLAFGQTRRFRGGPPDPTERGNVPQWHLTPGFEQDAFVFARLKYRSTMDRTSYAWWTDYRDADLNLSYRLQQVTALRVDPEGRVIELDPRQLADHPFVFMSGVPAIVMDDREIRVLRDYLLNGGFLLVDDFWGERPWDHFHREVLRRLFPAAKRRNSRWSIRSSTASSMSAPSRRSPTSASPSGTAARA